MIKNFKGALFVLIAVMLFSCKVTKRKYRPGFYVNRHKHVKVEPAPATSNAEKTFYTSTQDEIPLPGPIPLVDTVVLEISNDETAEEVLTTGEETKIYPQSTVRKDIDELKFLPHIHFNLENKFIAAKKSSADSFWFEFLYVVVALAVTALCIAIIIFPFFIWPVSVFTVSLSWCILVLGPVIFISLLEADWGGKYFWQAFLRFFFLFTIPVIIALSVYFLFFYFTFNWLTAITFYFLLLGIASLCFPEKAYEIWFYGILVPLIPAAFIGLGIWLVSLYSSISLLWAILITLGVLLALFIGLMVFYISQAYPK